jgi:hypothetical protein
VINEPAPISESLRKSFGRLALLPDPTVREFQLRYPLNPAKPSSPDVTNATEKLVPEHINNVAGVPFVGSSIDTLFTELPRAQVEASADQLKRALKETPLLPGVVERLQAGLTALGQQPLPLLPPDLAARLLAQPPAARDYRVLTGCDCDSVMELAVYRQAFRAELNGNPPMSFQASVHVYVTRVSDGSLLFVQPFDYRTKKYLFRQWAEQNARRLRAELTGIRADAAQAIIEQFFAQ